MNKEEEIIFTDETVYDSSVSLMQRDRDTDDIYISYSTPKTPSRTFIANGGFNETRPKTSFGHKTVGNVALKM